ncbi:MAG: nucleotide exchange factor GrpE [Clostridiales Family XIII bacterium]|jgi:molecular chaperone GrpE|nr:nucleotide exchange factor GrpE [Clostridiales Family XIII bacterium]
MTKNNKGRDASEDVKRKKGEDAAGETDGVNGAGPADAGEGAGDGAENADAAEDTKDTDAESGSAEEEESIRYMRLAADFQNYKKRTEKERFERYTDGKKDFAADLLSVLDNFERAIAQDAAENAGSKFIEGMELIYQQLQDVLSKNGVGEIAALGADFDPNLHHAVIMEPSEGYTSGKVSAVLQKGYAIKEKVIRPAMVKVAE